MQNNLYEKIKEFVALNQELNSLAGFVMHDKTKKSLYTKLLEAQNQNNKVLDEIRNNCMIKPLDLEKIISEQENDEYRLKIFREQEEKHDETGTHADYTGRLIACFLNKNNKFFNSNENPVVSKSLFNHGEYINNSLSPEDFEKLLVSLAGNTKFILSTSDELPFMTLSPAAYLDGINFADLVFYGRVDDIIRDEFQKNAEVYVQQYLEQINADEFIENLEAQGEGPGNGE